MYDSIARWGTVMLCLLACPGTGAATENRDGFQFQTGVVAGYAQLNELENAGSGPGEVNSSDTNDESLGLSLGMGYQLGDFRGEVEYVWRYRYDLDVDLGDQETLPRFKSNIQTQTLMFNLYWDLMDGRIWHPYLGAGIGFASNRTDTEQRFQGSGSHQDNTTSGFAWALMAGAQVDLVRRWSLNLGYRFAGLGDVSTGTLPDGHRLESNNFTSHDLRLGLVYRFQ